MLVAELLQPAAHTLAGVLVWAVDGPPDVARTVHPYDDYVLARSLVDAPVPEDDLFAGIREGARR